MAPSRVTTGHHQPLDTTSCPHHRARAGAAYAVTRLRAAAPKAAHTRAVPVKIESRQQVHTRHARQTRARAAPQVRLVCGLSACPLTLSHTGRVIQGGDAACWGFTFGKCSL